MNIDMTKGVYRRIYAGGLRDGTRINNVSVGAAWLFVQLHAAADDYGNLRWHERLLLADAAPRRASKETSRNPVKRAHVRGWMAELVSERLVETYETPSGERYAHIAGYEELQPGGKNGRRYQRHPLHPGALVNPGETKGIRVNPGESGCAQSPQGRPIPIPIPKTITTTPPYPPHPTPSPEAAGAAADASDREPDPDPAPQHDAAESHAMLTGVRSASVRRALARRHSPAEIRAAQRLAAKAKNANDRAGLVVSLLRDGSAAQAALDSATERAAAVRRTALANLERHWRAMYGVWSEDRDGPWADFERAVNARWPSAEALLNEGVLSAEALASRDMSTGAVLCAIRDALAVPAEEVS